jgi:DNA-binding NarL/FixJ family response regulator
MHETRSQSNNHYSTTFRDPGQASQTGDSSVEGIEQVPVASSQSEPTADQIDVLAALSRTERSVAVLVAEGLSNHRTARTLNISPRTVEVHLTHIYAKLGIDSRLQLAIRVVKGSKGQVERTM